jgi:hypothetical protein
MSKAQLIREALQHLGPNEMMSAADVSAKTGIEGIHPHLSSMVRSCEVISRKLDGVKMYCLDPDYVPSRQRKLERDLPIKRKSKRAKGKKKHAGKTPRSMKEVAKRFVDNTPAASTASIRDLAINNLIASAQALADTLRREVEGVENNPNLMAAIETQERAAEIARAA